MKYIRTKDGRISYLSREPNEEITDYEIITSKGTLTYRREDEVIKVADTIEELCDEVVIIYPNGNHSISFCYDYKSFYESIEAQVGHLDKTPYTKENLAEYEIYEIYGAIWTDKGLKYVAKMNDKGELELL